MQSEYLIKEIQQGLLKWYDFKPNSTFLYLGEKDEPCAALLSELAGQTACMSAAQASAQTATQTAAQTNAQTVAQTNAQTAAQTNVQTAVQATAQPADTSSRLTCASPLQTLTPQWQQAHTAGFDYIIAIETLETLESPAGYLSYLKSLLKPDGTLLLGMNNRFGLRYFCGDRDPYTERNFDGIEGYRRAYAKKEDTFQGRCYSQAELRSMLQSSGFETFQFYSVLSDLKNPSFLYAEDYLPNEDLSNRIFPTYHYPDTVFLDEESLYNSLAENGMFHEMANAYLIECPLSGRISDVSHVTSSMERGPERALLTIIHRSGIVEKRAAHSEGNLRLKNLIEHGRDLSAHGISVVEAKLGPYLPAHNILDTIANHEANLSRCDTTAAASHPNQVPPVLNTTAAAPTTAQVPPAHAAPTAPPEPESRPISYLMPYITAEVGQLYLKRLLHEDQDMFLRKLDEFRNLILQSSEIIEPDHGDGNGAVLRKGYIDMVPLNSFYLNDTFVFYDQEFCEEHYPANALIWRMIATFYAGDLEVQKLMPMETLLNRYDLKRKLSKWQKLEWDFLADLRQEKTLRKYHEACRRNYDAVNSNRQRLNYSAEKYQKLFIDIFRNADTRKLILFGSGNFTKRFLSLYGQDYPVYAIVDNSREKWGQEVEGISIQSPEILRSLQSGEYKILICIKNYLSVMKQLDGMGVTEYSIYDPGKDYPRKRKPLVPQNADAVSGSADHSAVKKKYHTGYIAGVFDLFHVGHLNMFKRAKEQCDYLIVGVVTDEGVRKFKEVEPFVPYEERAEMVRSCRYVDEVVEIPLNFGGTRDAWRLHHFDCQFSGSDYVDNPDWLAEKEFLEKHGAEMEFFPYTQSTSSSKIKDLIDKKLL